MPHVLRVLAVALSFVLLTHASAVADTVRGHVAFLENCPGDTISNGDEDEAGFLAALLTPLLTGVVNQGLKTAGQKLTEAAKEASVDVVHRGGHFYRFRLAEEDFDLTFRCVVVASKGTDNSGRTLAELTAGYKSTDLKLSRDDRLPDRRWLPNPQTLEEHLQRAGFATNQLPGIVGVFELELSAQRTDARLIPRFVAMDHSVREKKVDSKARTVTFEFSFDSPHSEKPFGVPLVKIDKLVIGEPYVQEFTTEKEPVLASQWFAVPALATGTTQRLTAHVEARKARDVDLQAAELAGVAAANMGDQQAKVYVNDQGQVACPGATNSRKLWVEKHAALQAEKAKSKEKQDPAEVSRLTLAELFFKSCTNHHHQVERLDKGFKDAALARAFDVTVTLKEFRKRPFAEFFGAVLSDDTARGNLTQAIVAGIDPATKAAQQQEEEEQLLALREAYETAVVEAEKAILGYESAKPEDKALKFVEMEAKKRTANRKARALKIPPPYPEAGTWI